mmetsp:Transcript_75990/g.180790  ORF Transcript_75990/g.180790 Transcript_75990/m.180790 type:complete len:553 (+) Transcript_75990:112-1770(+)|eukprot:CAMPEP_0178414464 /NCGR_PEP_ID=MMETSP0689_2-20121128/23049_1 /TAXON_ID=160604 /ORGANISM="Amphidinium massartii, Strain CS-259" /LENGTH=552 /DNA_ID=CAMNT_0020035753 /DNA_START=109 /DNA_END=1767 /DNA_ORIENTATION=+
MVDCNATIPEECKAAVNGGSNPSYIFALWNLLIRPPRATYSTEQLGPATFQVRGKNARREDLKLRTRRGSSLACSFFMPERPAQLKQAKMPVIIYLHGNSSSRLEAGSILLSILECGMALFCYDASGCGQSDGEYVSLGWHERDDLAVVINYIRSKPEFGQIGLWGRSMGAVTALLHADRDASLGAICVDSPFANLRQLMEELACGRHALLPLPSWLVSFLMSVIKERVKALADFDIDDLKPIEHAKRSHVPALFLHGVKDTFISEDHAHALYEAYAGRTKELHLLDGDHNSKRGTDTISSAVRFFCDRFGWFVSSASGMPKQVEADQVPEKPKASFRNNPGRGQPPVIEPSRPSCPVIVEPALRPSQRPQTPRTEARSTSRSRRPVPQDVFEEVIRSTEEAKPFGVRPQAGRERDVCPVSMLHHRARSVDGRGATGVQSEPLSIMRQQWLEDEEVCYALQGLGGSNRRSRRSLPGNLGSSHRSASWPPNHQIEIRRSQNSMAMKKTRTAPKIMTSTVSRLMKKLRKPSDCSEHFEQRFSMPVSMAAARGGA